MYISLRENEDPAQESAAGDTSWWRMARDVEHKRGTRTRKRGMKTRIWWRPPVSKSQPMATDDK